MKINLLICFFTFAVPSIYVHAQSDTLVWYEGVQLQAEDFRSKSEAKRLEIHYEFDYQLIPTSFYQYVPIVRGRAVFDRKASSMGGNTTRDGLRYAQVLFDLHGLHVRKTELRIFEMGRIDAHVFGAKDIIGATLKKAEKELKKETARFERALVDVLGNGKDSDPVFSTWEHMIRDSLAKVPRLVIRQEEKFTLGVVMGAGHSSFLGKTGDYFTNLTSIALGFHLDVKKRSRFGLDMRMGNVRTLQRLQAKGEWEDDLKSLMVNFEFSYGYRIFMGKKAVLVPFAGLGVNSFSPVTKDKKDKRSLTGYSPIIGLEFNQPLARWRSASGSTSLFCKPKVSYSPSNFVKNMSGPQINFSLFFGIDEKQIRTRMVKTGLGE